MAEFEVTTIEDTTANDGLLSLREAIALANADPDADKIAFAASLAGQTITSGGSALVLETDITINGDINGDNVADITIDGNDVSEVLFVAGGTAILDALAITGGASANFGGGITVFGGGILDLMNSTVTGNVGGYGGGIFNGSTATLTNSTVSGNVASRGGGGIFNRFGEMVLTNSTVAENVTARDGGGIYSSGTTTLTNSTVTGNMATDDGGGLYNSGTMTLTNTVVSENTAGSVDAPSGTHGGGIFNRGEATFTDSTVSGNAAGSNSSGGGAYNFAGGRLDLISTTLTGNTAFSGGGIANRPDANLTLTNSTLAENTATGATGLGGGITNNGSATLTNSTLSGNAASAGGGISNNGSAATTTLINTIVLGNSAASAANINGTFTSSSRNSLTGADGERAVDVFAEVVDGAGVLADNGGPVQTIALRAAADNPALDVDGFPTSLSTDALGNRRAVDLPGVGNSEERRGIIDAGAVELQLDAVEDQSLIVTTTADVVDPFDGETSLREAIEFANADADLSEITFAVGLTGTITLTQGRLVITSDVNIDGDVVGDDNIADITIDGNEQTDIFRFEAGSSTLESLAIVKGRTSFSNNGGAAFIASDATLIVRDSVFEGNSAGSGGTILNRGTATFYKSEFTGNIAFASGGAIANGGTLTLVETDLFGNMANYGGAIRNAGEMTLDNVRISENEGFIAGGGIYNLGTATLTQTILSGNAAANIGGGLFNHDNGILRIDGGTISKNSAQFSGGGAFNFGQLSLIDTELSTNSSGYHGGAIHSIGNASLSITNTTLVGNTARLGGAIYARGTVTLTNTTVSENTATTNGGGLWLDGDSTLINATISGNLADSGGGIYTIGTTTLRNSIVLGNRDSFDQNILGEVTATNSITSGEVTSVFANVADGAGVLADNGGPVRTIALLADADNPALDNAVDAVESDARGRSRSDFSGLGLGIADIGAFELVNEAPIIRNPSFNVAEGQTTVGTVTTEDDIDTGVTLRLTGGADADLFTFNPETGALAFVTSQNFEAPTDANADNTYEITISTFDGAATGFRDLTVQVTDVSEAETIETSPDGGTTTGSDEADQITGDVGDDVVNAGLGDDIIVDAGGDDTVNAGGGDDRVGLLSGMNSVGGGAGADLIVGGFGNDTLNGDAGMDVIRGDISTNLFGSDRIAGGAGDDLLEGRGGVDTFVFATNDGNDTIGALDIDFDTLENTTVTGADFVSGVDVIELSGFALADRAAALAAVTDVEGVATFAAEGTVITFAGLTVDDLAADDFVLV